MIGATIKDTGGRELEIQESHKNCTAVLTERSRAFEDGTPVKHHIPPEWVFDGMEAHEFLRVKNTGIGGGSIEEGATLIDANGREYHVRWEDEMGRVGLTHFDTQYFVQREWLENGVAGEASFDER